MQKIRPDLDIGKNIQLIRYQHKLTQDQVVAKLNLMGIVISKSTYAKLETNRMNIKVSELIAPLSLLCRFRCSYIPYFIISATAWRQFTVPRLFSLQFSLLYTCFYSLSHFYNRFYLFYRIKSIESAKNETLPMHFSFLERI